MAREINIVAANSKEEGSCNACTAHSTPSGIAEHRVWKIDIRTCSLRLCDGCMDEFISKANSAFRNAFSTSAAK